MKKNNRILFVLTVFFMLTSFTVNNENFVKVKDKTKILNELKSVAGKTTTIQADFTEEKYLAAFKNPQISSGKFYYKATDKMRWEQQKPFEYIILINGKSLRIKENGKEKKIPANGRIALKINDFMLKIIKGDFENDDFETLCYQSNNRYKLELTPKTKQIRKIYTKFELFFSKKDKRLQQIIFFEANGNKKITTYSNQKYNENISDKIFNQL